MLFPLKLRLEMQTLAKGPQNIEPAPQHGGTQASSLMFPIKAEITLFLFCLVLPEFPSRFHS